MNDDVKAAHIWKELFPEAFIVDTQEELNIILANVKENGLLVILASTSTTLCRDLFLNIVITCSNIMVIKDYAGFFIDDYQVTNATQIYELLAPRQQVRVANNTPDFNLRSYWLRRPVDVLEGQLFPALVDRATIPIPIPGNNTILFLVFIFFFILAIIYWIIVLFY
jgi:hypothetical protein